MAKGTHKGTWGHHPLTAWCDNTGESLAVMLRPGNAGSNTAADHIAITDAAVAQIPARYRRKMLVTCDGAGATHALVQHVTGLNARPGYQPHYSVGFDFDERIRDVLPRLPGSAWTPALDADGAPRPDAQVAELTGLLRHSAGGDRLAGWPPDMRILIRRENPHPGAQLTLFEQHEGKRYQVTATSTQGGQAQFLEARHRTQARVEDRIRCAKSTGLGHLPSVILSPKDDHGPDLVFCDADGVADVAAVTGCRHGVVISGSGGPGVSRPAGLVPRMLLARCSPRARARASRSCWLSSSRWRMRAVAASRRRSRDAPEARCWLGTRGDDGVSRCRCLRCSICGRRSAWA